MKKRFAVGVSMLAISASLLAAPGASAAVEFGDNCGGTSTVPEYTLVDLVSAGSLPVAAPSSGVITKLKTSVAIPIPFQVPTSIKVLRPAGSNNYTVVGQTTMNVGVGSSAANTRLPVQAGDRLGMRGLPFSFEGSSIPSIAFYCPGGLPASLGASAGSSDPQPGATLTFSSVGPAGVPVVAVLEPDADGDGYGDETQDLCPQSAAAQVACPVVSIDSFALIGRGSVRVLVTASNSAAVKVKGTVKLGKAGKAKLSGGAKTVAAGKLVSFKLKFPEQLKDALKELDPGQKLKLKIVASATNVAGTVSSDKLNVKLKGQG
jgi:hypothetical protein